MPAPRLLDTLQPLVPFVPRVDAALAGRLGITERALWTAGTLALYLSLLSFPLFAGEHVTAAMDTPDAWAHLRNILAARRGTLGELGVAPVVTAGIVAQAAAAWGLVDVDFARRDDRALFGAAQKVLALAIAFIQTLTLILSGTYGPPTALSPATILLIVFQLVGATLLTIVLDEIVTSGYGIGSGISNFIAGATASTIISSAFSLSWVNTIAGPQYQGSLVALIHALVKSHSKPRALKLVFYRDYLPNVWSALTTTLLFFACVYLQSFRTEVPLKNMRARGMRVNYPVKLLYTSAIPLILTGTLASHLFLASQTLFQLLPRGNLVSKLITGTWAPLSTLTHPATQSALSTTSLIHLLTPPTSLWNALTSPVQLTTYTLVLLTTTVLLARAWLHISGSGPAELAKQFKEQQLVVAGHREGSMVRELKKVVPSAAMSGAACLAALAVVGDVLGVYGGGVAFVTTATTIYNLFELGMKEIMGPDMPGGMGDMR